MTALVTLITKLCVVPSGKPIYDEAATLVGLDDGWVWPACIIEEVEDDE